MWWRWSLLVFTVLVVDIIVVLTGCQPGNQPGINPNLHPQKPAVGNPYVLVVGDEQVTAWLTPDILQNRPLWTAAGSPLGTQEDSGSVATRLAKLLAAKHYDVVVILAGTFDMTNPSWLGLCNYDATAVAPFTDQTCQALWLMFQSAHSAGSKVLVCTVPETESQSPLYDYRLNASEVTFDENVVKDFGYDPDWKQDGIVDLRTTVLNEDWTTDGLLPNASGAQAFTSATEAVIANLKGNWGNK